MDHCLKIYMGIIFAQVKLGYTNDVTFCNIVTIAEIIRDLAGDSACGNFRRNS